MCATELCDFDASARSVESPLSHDGQFTPAHPHEPAPRAQRPDDCSAQQTTPPATTAIVFVCVARALRLPLPTCTPSAAPAFPHDCRLTCACPTTTRTFRSAQTPCKSRAPRSLPLSPPARRPSSSPCTPIHRMVSWPRPASADPSPT